MLSASVEWLEMREVPPGIPHLYNDFLTRRQDEASNIDKDKICDDFRKPTRKQGLMRMQLPLN